MQMWEYAPVILILILLIIPRKSHKLEKIPLLYLPNAIFAYNYTAS